MAIVTDRQVRCLHALLRPAMPSHGRGNGSWIWTPKQHEKYRDRFGLPSELQTWPHAGRTGEDPFVVVWDEVREQLDR